MILQWQARLMKDLWWSKENVCHQLICKPIFKWCIIFDNHDGNLLFQEYTENRHLQLSSASSNLLADLQPASIDIRYIP